MEKSLFDIPITHTNDPPASCDGAIHITACKRFGHIRVVFDLLKRHRDSTSGEIAYLSGTLDYYQVQKRMSDLRELGLVEYGQKRECRIRHTPCMTWILTDKGKEI